MIKVFTKIKRIRDHRHYVKFITIIVWSAAFGLTVPTLLHSKYDEDTYQCQQDWPGYDHRLGKSGSVEKNSYMYFLQNMNGLFCTQLN